jgi:hypothetical protein
MLSLHRKNDDVEDDDENKNNNKDTIKMKEQQLTCM